MRSQKMPININYAQNIAVLPGWICVHQQHITNSNEIV